jgi:hypothetical protein
MQFPVKEQQGMSYYTYTTLAQRSVNEQERTATRLVQLQLRAISPSVPLSRGTEAWQGLRRVCWLEAGRRWGKYRMSTRPAVRARETEVPKSGKQASNG